MIRVKTVTSLTPGFGKYLMARSAFEWMMTTESHRQALYKKSKRIWIVYNNETPLCVVGLVNTSLLGSRGEFWFLLCEGFTKHRRACLKFLRRGLIKVVRTYKHLKVNVDRAFVRGCRFVRYFGFEKVAVVNSLDGRVFDVFELRA